MHETREKRVAFALNAWANHIETGNITFSATDAKKMHKKPRPLNTEKRVFVAKLREESMQFTMGQLTVLTHLKPQNIRKV